MKRGMLPSASISVRLVWPYLRLIDAKGMSMEPEAVTAWLVDPNARIDHGIIIKLMLESIEREADAARGLKAAMLIEPGDRDPLEHAARGCSNLGEAYRSLCRWFPVLNSASELSLCTNDERVELRYRVVRGDPEPPAFADSVIAWLARFTRQYAGVSDEELEFHFTQPRPSYAEEYAQYFSGKFVFSSDHNALVVPKACLHNPLPWQSPTLTRAYQLRAEQVMSELGLAPDTIAESVRTLVAQHLDERIVTMQWVADQLETSVPTLRRRLRDEQTTFSAVVDQLRAELAERRLMEGRASIAEVAQALGFANVSAFDRAFKRWRGAAPSKYRARPPANGNGSAQSG